MPSARHGLLLLNNLRQNTTRSPSSVLCYLRHRTSSTSQSSTSPPKPSPKRARNLSARYDPTIPLNYASPELLQQSTEAKSQGLSPQGLANPKSVEAAARLKRYDDEVQHPHGDHIQSIGGVKVEVPAKPDPPGPEGCAICVHDLYADALKEYRDSLRRLRETLRLKSVHESLWPKELIALSDGGVEDEDGADLDPTMKAFMQMEKGLKRKKEATTTA